MFADQTSISFDQTDRQPQRFAQTLFLALHLPVIVFVVIPGEMKYPMQSENSDFVSDCVPKALRVVGGNLRRNGYISGEAHL